MPTVDEGAGVRICDTPATVLTVLVMLLDAIVEGEEQVGDPANGVIVQ
jgi:hypothetical protein